MLDKIGNEIKVGSLIAYGHALGRCAAIQIGVVLEVREATDPRQTSGDGAPRIRVRGFNRDERWAYQWRDMKNWTPLNKDSHIWFPDRVIVLKSVPDKDLNAAIEQWRKTVSGK